MSNNELENESYLFSYDKENVYSSYQTSSYPSKTESQILEGPIRIFLYDTCGILKLALARDKFIEYGKTLPEYHMINIKNSYPAIITGGETSIIGEIWEIVPRTLIYLDSIAEHPFNFRREIITLSNDDKVYIYIMNRWKTPTKEEYILSGNWIQWKMEKRLRKKLAKNKELITNNNNLFNSNFEQKLSGTISNNHYSSRSVVHVSTLKTTHLRVMLRDNGHAIDEMSDEEIRVEAVNRYGLWFSIENRDII